MAGTHVLTAAHCMFTSDGTAVDEPTSVRVGALTSTGGTLVAVSSVTNHPSYDPTDISVGNDISIITLATAVTGITPILYNTDTTYPDGTTSVAVTAYGYGGINAAGDLSSVLRKANTFVVADSTCTVFSGYLPDQQVCTTISTEGTC